MPWVDAYVPGTQLRPGKLQCCLCKALTRDDYIGMKPARKIAGAQFKDNKTLGEVRCPRCQETKNPCAMQHFNTFWQLALPGPLPESKTSAASDQIAQEIINRAGNPPPGHNSKASDDGGQDARCDTPGGFVLQPERPEYYIDEYPPEDALDENPWLELNDDLGNDDLGENPWKDLD